MEICPAEPRAKSKIPSVIEIKNRIRAGHPECCSCCCCSKPPEFASYRYIQPEVPKSYKPELRYEPTDEPIEDCTTYKLSFWNNPTQRVEPVVPEGNLTVSPCSLTDDTTHKMSYVGNWDVEPTKPLKPCERERFGRGPMLDKTVQKLDYVWKCSSGVEPMKFKNNLCLPKGCVEDDTTYKLSFYESRCVDPIKSFKPVTCYEPTDVPIEDCTTYKLSYFQDGVPEKMDMPWKKNEKYTAPVTPLEDRTTYNQSYWPNCVTEKSKPVLPKGEIEPARGPVDPCTTYKLSYFDGTGAKTEPAAVPPNNLSLSNCPMTHDTTNKMSYFPNWEPKTEAPMLPCPRDLLGRGPIETDTTNKLSFMWNCDQQPIKPLKPSPNLGVSSTPIEGCTVNKMSYLPNWTENLTPSKSYAPVYKYEPTDAPMESCTTANLSYQPVDYIEPVEKPWAKKPTHHEPVVPLDENTTYSLSYYPPGILVL